MSNTAYVRSDGFVVCVFFQWFYSSEECLCCAAISNLCFIRLCCDWSFCCCCCCCFFVIFLWQTRSALNLACKNEHVSIAVILVQAGAKVPNTNNNSIFMSFFHHQYLWVCVLLKFFFGFCWHYNRMVTLQWKGWEAKKIRWLCATLLKNTTTLSFWSKPFVTSLSLRQVSFCLLWICFCWT